MSTFVGGHYSRSVKPHHRQTPFQHKKQKCTAKFEAKKALQHQKNLERANRPFQAAVMPANELSWQVQALYLLLIAKY